MSITLEIPSLAHKKACEKMIAKWMRFGGEIHPGLLRRYSERQGVVRYEQWLEQLVETEDEQQLYFLMQEQRMLGAIALRPHEQGESLLVNGHLRVWNPTVGAPERVCRTDAAAGAAAAEGKGSLHSGHHLRPKQSCFGEHHPALQGDRSR